MKDIEFLNLDYLKQIVCNLADDYADESTPKYEAVKLAKTCIDYLISACDGIMSDGEDMACIRDAYYTFLDSYEEYKILSREDELKNACDECRKYACCKCNTHALGENNTHALGVCNTSTYGEYRSTLGEYEKYRHMDRDRDSYRACTEYSYRAHKDDSYRANEEEN